jgi:hypothetical protein
MQLIKHHVLFLILQLVGWSYALSQTPPDSLYIKGLLHLHKNLSAELQWVSTHLHEEEKLHAHTTWARYLDKPHPSVAALEVYFQQAAHEFGVPAELLKAIAQLENNWTQIGPSIDQGWGMMHLVQNNYCNTLQEAALLLRLPQQVLQDDAQQNIRGAAALLKKYYRKQGKGSFVKDAPHTTDWHRWWQAAKTFSGLFTDELRTVQANRYFSVIKDGARSTTLWGEVVSLPRHKHIPAKFTEEVSNAAGAPRSADYGPAITSFTTCNFSSTRNHTIDTYVNHWIGTGTAAGAVSWFQNCNAQASAHFVVNNSGSIYQVVPVASTAWHCGASGYPYNNGRSIGVEHEATVANPGLWNSTAMLQASAK